MLKFVFVLSLHVHVHVLLELSVSIVVCSKWSLTNYVPIRLIGSDVIPPTLIEIKT